MIKGQVSAQAQILLFLFFALTIAVLLKQLQRKFTFISYTPTLFFISVAFGYFYEYEGIVGQATILISDMDPRGILIIFLPPLIFESAFNSDWHIFRKQSTQIFILAFPAVFISALLIMFSIKVIIGYDESYYNYPEAFMFGSVLSCTDTVAVLALLKQAGAPKKFNSLIEGESLLNDGTCMVLLTISFELIKGSAPPPLTIGLLFLQLTLGGIILGIIFGAISTFLIDFVKNDAILTLNITLASCFLLYFTAQYVNLGIRVSGIMALVSMGLYLAAFGRTKIPAQTRQKVHHFWKIVVYITQTIIFIIGGVIVGIKVLNNRDIKVIGQSEVFKLIALYCCMTLARFTAIAIFMPKLRNEGYGLKWNQVLILTYGGLRGAVGISFALILAADATLNKKFTFISLFNMAGCSILTLVINANTAGFMIKKVGLCVKSDTKTRLFVKFMKECLKDLNHRFQQLQKNIYVENSDWLKVKEKAGVIELQKKIDQTQQRITKHLPSNTPRQMKSVNWHSLDQHLLGQNDQALMMQLRNRFCIVLKGIIWQKFQNNQCSSQSVLVLNECVDFDLDTIEEPINSFEYLMSHLHNKYFFPICFWCKKYPIIGRIADSMIFDRAGFIYDVVSTYIQALSESEQKSKEFPFDQNSLNQLIQESEQNRRLASAYLDRQIKISYPQIMKRIQTAKASHSILNYQQLYIKQNRRHGQLDEQFYKVLKMIIEKNISKVENESKFQNLTDMEILLSNQFFSELSEKDRQNLLSIKKEFTLEKDQPLIKQYEMTKFLYLITRGEVFQQCKINHQTLFKQSKRIYELVGVNSLLLTNRKQLQHCATANSIVCLFGFPIQQIKSMVIRNEKLQGMLYKQVLPCCSKVDQNYEKMKITPEILSKMRGCIEFQVCESKKERQISGEKVIIVQGKIQKEGNTFLRGYFEIDDTDTAKIYGPAKYFVLDKNYTLMDQMVKARQSSVARQNLIENRADTIIERALYQ